MKKRRIYIISRIVIVMFLVFSFSASIFAQEKADAAKEERIKKCLRCCDNKYLACININPDRRLCAAENQACSETCKSEGASPSEWSDCWTQSE
ncbi:MAG: hypothetical protein ABFD50_11155 [Smithella sp.]